MNACLIIFLTYLILLSRETRANPSQEVASTTLETELLEEFPVAEAVFSSNLIPNVLMIVGSVVLVVVICSCVGTRMLSIADPFGVCRDTCDCACGGCGMMEEMVFCCAIS